MLKNSIFTSRLRLLAPIEKPICNLFYLIDTHHVPDSQRSEQVPSWRAWSQCLSPTWRALLISYTRQEHLAPTPPPHIERERE